MPRSRDGLTPVRETKTRLVMAANVAAALPRLQIFYGPMWSGKTNALIRTVDRLRLGGRQVVVVKPSVDTRSEATLTARTGLSLRADVVAHKLADVQVEEGTAYALDEAQFFTDLVPFWRRVAQRQGCSLLLSGLDLDYARKPFGSVLDLSRRALDEDCCTLSIERMAAMCNYKLSTGRVCGRHAYYSQRLGCSTATVLVGDSETYQPSCELHHSVDPVSVTDWRAGK